MADKNPMTVYTIGYGGRTKESFLGLALPNHVRTIVDVRLRPDKASIGQFAKAKTPDKGIEAWLSEAGIGYVSLVELGNVFLDQGGWMSQYRELLDRAGDLLTTRLLEVPGPYCLMCAEKASAECHRTPIANWLAKNHGATIVHLE